MSSPAQRDARLGERIDLVADLNAQDDDGQIHFSILPAPIDMNRHLLNRDLSSWRQSVLDSRPHPRLASVGRSPTST